jgi:hypothetical protein
MVPFHGMQCEYMGLYGNISGTIYTILSIDVKKTTIYLYDYIDQFPGTPSVFHICVNELEGNWLKTREGKLNKH